MTEEQLTEWYEERAAILEHVGGWPKEKAEALAKAELESHIAAICASNAGGNKPPSDHD